MKDYKFFIVSFVVIVFVWIFALTYVIGDKTTMIDRYTSKIDSLEKITNDLETKYNNDTIVLVIKDDNSINFIKQK